MLEVREYWHNGGIALLQHITKPAHILFLEIIRETKIENPVSTTPLEQAHVQKQSGAKKVLQRFLHISRRDGMGRYSAREKGRFLQSAHSVRMYPDAGEIQTIHSHVWGKKYTNAPNSETHFKNSPHQYQTGTQMKGL